MERTCSGHYDPQYSLMSLLSDWTGPSSLFNRTYPFSGQLSPFLLQMHVLITVLELSFR